MDGKQRQLGQYFTDPRIARFMAKLVCIPGCKLLDPAAGQGVFLHALRDLSADVACTAYEIDPEVIASSGLEQLAGLQLFRQDYLSSDPDQHFDMILCNPPYTKFKDLPHRAALIRSFEQKYGIRLSSHCNLYIYFLIKSLHELSSNGRCAYIVPFDFLNADYGVAVKKWLLESGMLRSVIKFDPQLHLFPDTLTTSCILLFENSPQQDISFISVSDLSQLETEAFSSYRIYHPDEIPPEEKWNRLFHPREQEYRNLVPLSTFAHVHRGIATGGNTFFSLSRSQAEAYGLSKKCCLPCVAKAPDINVSILTEDALSQMAAAGKKVLLFDGALAASDADFAYIRQGENDGINKSYLCSHRKCWYSPEYRPAAPIWIGTFCRNRLKVVRNEANALHMTSFHGIHVFDEALCELLFCYFLTHLGQELLLRNIRDCGGGLTKFQPNDLNRAMVLDLRLVTREDRAKIMELRKQIPNGDPTVYLPALEAIFLSYMTK